MGKSNAEGPKGKDQKAAIIWVEFLNKDMKRKGWEKVMQVDRRERIKRRRNI